MSRLELTITGVLLAIICGLSWFSFWQHSHKEASQTQYIGAAASSESHQAYAQGARALAIKVKKEEQHVEAVLEANRTWSEQPVPADVADLLRERATPAE